MPLVEGEFYILVKQKSTACLLEGSADCMWAAMSGEKKFLLEEENGPWNER